MSENERPRFEVRHETKMNPEEIKDILGVVSKEIPGMIKNVMGTVFSEEAGRNMGKAAGAYYKALKEADLPDDVAIKMTQEYMRTFTNIGEVFKNVQRFGRHDEHKDHD